MIRVISAITQGRDGFISGADAVQITDSDLNGRCLANRCQSALIVLTDEQHKRGPRLLFVLVPCARLACPLRMCQWVMCETCVTGRVRRVYSFRKHTHEEPAHTPRLRDFEEFRGSNNKTCAFANCDWACLGGWFKQCLNESNILAGRLWKMDDSPGRILSWCSCVTRADGAQVMRLGNGNARDVILLMAKQKRISLREMKQATLIWRRSCFKQGVRSHEQILGQLILCWHIYSTCVCYISIYIRCTLTCVSQSVAVVCHPVQPP